MERDADDGDGSGGRSGAWIKSALSGYSVYVETPSDAPGTAGVGTGMGDAALPTAAGAAPGVLVTRVAGGWPSWRRAGAYTRPLLSST